MIGRDSARIRKGLLALGAAGCVLALLASLYPTPLCACLTVAETALRTRSPELDPGHLQSIAERRYPRGMTYAELVASLGMASYAKYCLQGRGGALVCLFPHDANFWRDRHVQVAFAFDAARRLTAVRASAIVRTAWF